MRSLAQNAQVEKETEAQRFTCLIIPFLTVCQCSSNDRESGSIDKIHLGLMHRHRFEDDFENSKGEGCVQERGKGYSSYPEMTETGSETLSEDTFIAFGYIYTDIIWDTTDIMDRRSVE